MKTKCSYEDACLCSQVLHRRQYICACLASLECPGYLIKQLSIKIKTVSNEVLSKAQTYCCIVSPSWL